MTDGSIGSRVRQARKWVPVGTLALLTMGLVALGARKLPGSGSTRRPVVIDFDLQQALTNFFLTAGSIIAVAVVVVMFWPGQDPLELPRRSLAKYVLGPLGILVFVALLFLWPRPDPEPPVQSPTPDTVADIAPPAPGGEAPVWGFYALVGTIGLALIVIGRRARAEAPPPATREEAVDPGLEIEAFLDLPDGVVDGDDPRARVIGAYVELIRAFVGRRFPPRASETPREFAARTHRRFESPAGAVDRLTELFELARFSQHALTAADADEAREVAAAARRRLEESSS